MAKDKWVYSFGAGKAEGRTEMKNLLGGKGANLAEMTSIGVPAPGGFTITTDACVHFSKANKWPTGLDAQIKSAMKLLEKNMKASFGDRKNPLLVSVRSGARVSMPGMMDTVLNLGMNDQTVQGLIAASKNERFAWDSYRRFVQMYGDVVMGVDHHNFEALLQAKKDARGVELDTDLSAKDLEKLVREYKAMVVKATGKRFPDAPREQLIGAINAVFGSWNNKRAFAYRRLNSIPHEWGTAVNVQAMVYGNMGDDSATGVAFTRDPSTGEKRFYGEYLINAQGEDVVAGIRTPQPITIEQKNRMDEKLPAMEEEMPRLYDELCVIYRKLEKHYRDMQDIEFTIQKGKLYLLQTRTGKRTGTAALRIAVDMVDERLIGKDEGVMRVSPDQLDQLLHPMIDPDEKVDLIAKGLPASPGAVSGRVVFTAEDAVEWVKNGEKVILVRLETSPEDISGMAAAEGILTARGGMTSHAAVVGRGMGKTCVVGCGAVQVEYKKKRFVVGKRVFNEGDWVTLDGSAGRVLDGRVRTVEAKLDANYDRLMSWADKARRMQVWTNADAPEDAERARSFGAQGIGLCRTEHMFFGEDRLPIVQKMIMNLHDAQVRKECLEKLLPMQRKDFYGILKAMDGFTVTIRLLDPPLHEFLPKATEVIEKLTKLRVLDENPREQARLEKVLRQVEGLEEINPMLGHRGCRLGISFPEIYDMQVRAIMEAATQLIEEGVAAKPDIMIPLIGTVQELSITRLAAESVIKKVKESTGVKVPHHIGTMIEIPRAALTSAQVAKHADFYSFGTNDLTQMTYGYSRDDVGKFVPEYIEKGVLAGDPFVSIDPDGVGRLMDLAITEGRSTNPKLKIGICGEHGGEDKSVKLCHRLGLNYVSCSPFRVPIARLAAAQAAIMEKRDKAAARKGTKEKVAVKKTVKKAAKKKVAKKKVVKKAAPKKKVAKKKVVKKKVVKKAAPKKRVVKKKVVKKAAPKKRVVKKAAPKKKVVKKKIVKKAAPKKKVAKKKVVKKKAVKKAAPKKRVVKKAAPKKKVAKKKIVKKAAPRKKVVKKKATPRKRCGAKKKK